MSKQYDNTNRGTLNKNKDKLEAKHADYRGQINVDGKDYWLNAWLKDGPNGKFMSLSVKPKEGKPNDKPKQAEPAFDDDLPF